MANDLDLTTIFKAVTQQLSQQKTELNEVDTYNHDHGDHMVQIFDLIQKSVAKKSKEPVNKQLEYASKVVEKEADSGSAKLYAQGLSSAAKNMAGETLNPNTIGTLVKSLLNVEEPEEKQANSGLFGSLLSGLTGGGEKESEGQKVELDDLLRAGLAFVQSKQGGGSNTEAIINALIAASPLGESAHRSQSGSLVASTIMSFAQAFQK